MDTSKECIEWLRDTKYPSNKYLHESVYNNIIEDIIKRLQMWEDFKREGLSERFIKLNNDCTTSSFKIGTYMDEFEQVYFSKPKIRKEVKVEVLAENEDVIDELAKGIEDMNGQNFSKGKIRVVTTRWEKD